MKKWWMCVVLLSSCMLYGCGFTQEKEVQNQIENLLEEKYGVSFTVRSVEQEKGMTVFQSPEYHAIVTLDEEDTAFDAYTDLKITVSRDGYAKLLYEDAINIKVESLLRETEGLNGYSFWTRYSMETRAWSAEDALETYLEESGTWVNIDLQTIDEEVEVVAERVYGVAELLKANGIPYSITYNHRGKNTYLTDDASTKLISFEDFKKRLERSL